MRLVGLPLSEFLRKLNQELLHTTKTRAERDRQAELRIVMCNPLVLASQVDELVETFLEATGTRRIEFEFEAGWWENPAWLHAYRERCDAWRTEHEQYLASRSQSPTSAVEGQ